MAKVMGEPARYMTNRSIRAFQNQVLVVFVVSYCLALGLGVLLGLHRQPYSIIAIVMSLALLPVAGQFIDKAAGKMERVRLNFRKGATGEARIAWILEALPDEYQVIHDIPTPFGNIDHVVVGPAGVFVIDAKNWKGIVTSDGRGELLLNGMPVQKPEARRLSRNIMSVKAKITAISGQNPYIHALLVFPSAQVDAKWGTTGHVNCLKDEGLYDYIVENKTGKRLTKREVESIAQAFLALATNDRGRETRTLLG